MVEPIDRIKIRNEKKGVIERIIPELEPFNIYRSHLARYNFALNYCKEKVVLDVACGVGYGSVHLSRNGAKRVIGLDISKDAINYGNSHYIADSLEFIIADAIKLPFEDNIFDVVVSFETIEHIHDYIHFISECKRVLKKNGLFICSSPIKRTSKPSNPHHIREFSYKEFRDIIENNFKYAEFYSQSPHIKILRFGGMLLSVFPAGSCLKSFIGTLISSMRVRNHFLLKKSNKNPTEVLDAISAILPYKNKCLYDYGIIICIAES